MGYGHNPLVLSHNGLDWQGTFGVTLRVLIDDVLTDGPIDFVVVVENDGAAVRRTARLVGRTAHALLLDDGSQLPIGDVLAVELP